jgi:hypothetical protein
MSVKRDASRLSQQPIEEMNGFKIGDRVIEDSNNPDWGVKIDSLIKHAEILGFRPSYFGSDTIFPWVRDSNGAESFALWECLSHDAGYQSSATPCVGDARRESEEAFKEVVEALSNPAPTTKEKQCSQCSTNLQESEEPLSPATGLESKPLSLLKSTPTLKPSSDTTTPASQSTLTSEPIIPNPENTTSIGIHSPVQVHPVLELAQDLITLNPVFGLRPCDASSRGIQNSWLLKILRDSSTEVFEQSLADSEWQAMRGTIRSSYRRLGLALCTAETDSSLLPTPTSYSEGSDTHRPAGTNKLERTLKLLPTPVARDGKGRTGTPNESLTEPIQEYLTGTDKMHPAVPGWMMGFPPGYAEKISMAGGATIQPHDTQALRPEPQDAEPVSSSTAELSCPNKPRSHSVESFTSIPSLPKMLCTIKQPGQPELIGTIAQDLGSEFSIRIEGSEQPVTVPKLYVFPGSQKPQSPEPTWKEGDRAYYQNQPCTILVPVGRGKCVNKTKIATAEDFEGFWVPTTDLAAASDNPNPKPRCAAPIAQANDLLILDAAQSQLKEQIAKFKGDRKKNKALKNCEAHLENIQELRAVVEQGQPLVGMWVTKQIPDFNCVGQIIEANSGEQSTWVQWWGNPTPYPEQLGILTWDEFAQTTTLEPNSKIRIIPGHKTLKPGTLFQVQDLHANGWVLTTDDQLISSKYWEVADDESQPQPTDTSSFEIPEPAEDIPATEAGSPAQDLFLEGLPRDSDFPREGQVQLQDETVQADLKDAGTEEENDLVYRQLLQMGIPPAQARYLASQGVR